MTKNDKSQLELFIADILDVAPKGDMLTMEHPIFSLSKRRDTRKWLYKTVTTISSGHGSVYHRHWPVP